MIKNSFVILLCFLAASFFEKGLSLVKFNNSLSVLILWSKFHIYSQCSVTYLRFFPCFLLQVIFKIPQWKFPGYNLSNSYWSFLIKIAKICGCGCGDVIFENWVKWYLEGDLLLIKDYEKLKSTRHDFKCRIYDNENLMLYKCFPTCFQEFNHLNLF